MTTIKKLSLASFAIMTLLLTACSNDDGGSGGGSSLPTYITGKVDGVSFTTNLEAAGVATKSGSGASSAIIISCANLTSVAQSEYESIQIALIGITATGTYIVNKDTNNTLGYIENHTPNHSWDTGDCSSASGTITVTSISETGIEGTFSFIGSDDDDCTSTKNVTEGHFKGTF
ncbi:MAG: hypothetical protein V4548_08275 [Bacteroidota bacterium]